ncbi:MBL fold metallo-hydrolase [Candidatus Woesebacteria bacterium]|nr:MBL fold metallo-hydrolase [Candidatus Woesebacteria bacterium]
MKLVKFKIIIAVFLVWLIFEIIKFLPDDYAHVIFCDVGQGDAILITHRDKQILVDGGPDEKVLECLNKHMPFGDRSINFLIISHMDLDHIGGLPLVLAKYEADIILMNQSLKKTDGFEALKTAISSKNKRKVSESRVISSFVGQQLVLSNLVRLIVAAPQVGYQLKNSNNIENSEAILSDKNSQISQKINDGESENDLSIAIYVYIGDVAVLLTGDMEEKGELAAIKVGLTDRVDIIKAGHHGSNSSSSRQFISILRPEISVISSGENNRYNHPSPRVIDIFNEFRARIYMTSSQGTIKFISDGVKYWRAI